MTAERDSRVKGPISIFIIQEKAVDVYKRQKQGHQYRLVGQIDHKAVPSKKGQGSKPGMEAF